MANDVFDLTDRQHSRQDGALHTELALIKIDGFVTRRRSLNGKVQPQGGMALRAIPKQTSVGEDHRIHAQISSEVDRPMPTLQAARLRVGVDRQQHLAVGCMGIAQTFAGRGGIEVQSSEIARVGVIAQSDINSIGALIDRGIQRGQ